jgi:hypothetical protein
MKVLYTSGTIKQEIERIFSKEKRKRIAISAFVGDSAEAYLPKRRNLTLVCWPNPCGTNPRTIRKLMSEGVKVYFSDKMHMKIYWTVNHGAIISSANLSTNAFGSGKLKEIGVLVSSEMIDIKKIISSLNIRKVTINELNELERTFNIFHGGTGNIRYNGRYTTFKEWYNKYQTPWKIGKWEEEESFSKEAIDKARNEYNTIPADSFLTHKKMFNEGEWILCLKLAGYRITIISWIYVHFLVKTKEKNYEAVQVWKQKVYNGMPFRIDTGFKTAFKKTAIKFGIENIKDGKVNKDLIHLILKNYRK